MNTYYVSEPEQYSRRYANNENNQDVYGIAALPSLCAGALTAAEQQKGISKSFPVGKGGALDVEIRGGSISVSGWERDEVAVWVTGVDEEEQGRIAITQEGTPSGCATTRAGGTPATCR